MPVSSDRFRQRILAVIEAMQPEDLEERVAPVKCSKHPESPECSSDYGVTWYGAPEYGTPEPDYGVPPGE